MHSRIVALNFSVFVVAFAIKSLIMHLHISVINFAVSSFCRQSTATRSQIVATKITVYASVKSTAVHSQTVDTSFAVFMFSAQGVLGTHTKGPQTLQCFAVAANSTATSSQIVATDLAQIGGGIFSRYASNATRPQPQWRVEFPKRDGHSIVLAKAYRHTAMHPQIVATILQCWSCLCRQRH